MKRFTKKIGLFLIPLSLLFLGAEYTLRAIPNDYSYKKKYLDSHATEIEVLILGNSHAYRGVLPEKLDLKSFNAAYISQSLDLDFLIFNGYKDKLKNLKYLVLNISYPSLFSSLTTTKEKWRLKNYNIYYDFCITYKPKNYSEILGNTFIVNEQKFNDYFFKNTSLITCTTLGGGPISNNNNTLKAGLKAAKRHTKKEFKYYKKYVNELDKIIKYAKQNQFKIVVITPPGYSYYVNNLEPNQLNLMQTTLDSIVLNNTNVYWLNLLKNKSYLYKDFTDPDHLSSQGAIKFTEQLNNFINSLSL
jgi:hypothetical protein